MSAIYNILFMKDERRPADANMAPNMKGVFPKFALKQLSPYIAFIVIFVHNVVLDRDFQCSCGNQDWECVLYMVLPFFILLFLQLWTDKTLQRTWKYTCVWTSDSGCCKECKCKCNCNCKCILVLLYHFIKAVFISLLWVVAVLIDGDWYVCCQNYKSETHPDLACKDRQKNITLEERKLIAEFKSKSLVIGLGILCVTLTFAFMSIFRLMKCCGKDFNCCRKIHYYKVILDEEENVLKEVLTTAAKEKLTEGIKNKILSGKWTECFDVAEEMINNNEPPAAAENEERNLQLEKLRLEVQRLRVEVQKLEPNTAERDREDSSTEKTETGGGTGEGEGEGEGGTAGPAQEEGRALLLKVMKASPH